RQDARRTMRRLAAPQASLKTCLDAAEQLVTVYWTGDPDALVPLMSALRSTIDPANSGRTFGPPHRPVTVEDVARAFAAHFLGAAAVAWSPGALTDDDWSYAQAHGRQLWAEYSWDWGTHDLVADPIFGAEPP